MSTDWNVHCVDCNVTHTFNDANHQDQLMAMLCKHSAAIAGLADLLRETPDVEFKTYWGAIDADWFRKHLGHKLVPIDEYGALLDQCAEYVDCECGSHRRCTLKLAHDGKHAAVKP